MYFDSFSEFIQMGTHGFYVWSAYGVTVVVMSISLWQPIKRRKEIIKDYERRIRRENQSS